VRDLLRAIRNKVGSHLSCMVVPPPETLKLKRKNAQVVTGLQTSCYKSVHKLSTSCVRTACSQLL
jgi:hypothetical protein